MKTALLILMAIASLALAPSKVSDQSTRFEFVDVYIDPHGKSLAAYQFELTVNANAAQIVGVEGGDHEAFKQAPYYDPAALQHNRIIVGAFNTGSALPNGKVRVARLHMRVDAAEPNFNATVQTAAGSNGEPVRTTITIQRGPTE